MLMLHVRDQRAAYPSAAAKGYPSGSAFDALRSLCGTTRSRKERDAANQQHQANHRPELPRELDERSTSRSSNKQYDDEKYQRTRLPAKRPTPNDSGVHAASGCGDYHPKSGQCHYGELADDGWHAK
jgi:hypothetical protein